MYWIAGLCLFSLPLILKNIRLAIKKRSVGNMMIYTMTLLCGEVAGLLSPDREMDQTNVVFLFLLKHDMFYSMYFKNNTMITEKMCTVSYFFLVWMCKTRSMFGICFIDVTGSVIVRLYSLTLVPDRNV